MNSRRAVTGPISDPETIGYVKDKDMIGEEMKSVFVRLSRIISKLTTPVDSPVGPVQQRQTWGRKVLTFG